MKITGIRSFWRAFPGYNSDMEKKVVVHLGSADYPAVIVRKKGMRRINVRYDEEKGIAKVSAPYFCSERTIEKALVDCLPRILKKISSKVSPYENGVLYFLGKQVYVGQWDAETMRDYLKKRALPVFQERVAFYEELMGVEPPYKVRAREMKTRYGVNSRKTHSITLQTSLIHFSIPIIDAVVVHELAHHFEFNHGKEFYAIVNRYCPDYKTLHNKLRKGIYE